MTAAEALRTHDIKELTNRMTNYAYDRLKTVGVKDFEGKEPYDLVADLLEKVVTGVRNFESAKCSFAEFLFGCLKSDIDAFFKKKKLITDKEFFDPPATDPESTKQEIQQYIEALKAEGAKADEIDVFEAKCEGIYKPAEIAEYLGTDVKAVYNIEKRLVRHLQKIQTRLKITA